MSSRPCTGAWPCSCTGSRPPEEADQDVVDDVRLGVEFCDVVPDVLIGSVSERLVIGWVGPKDYGVTIYPVQPDRCIVEVVEHILFGPLELCRCHGSPVPSVIGDRQMPPRVTVLDP